jgi:hypothetical protein
MNILPLRKLPAPMNSRDLALSRPCSGCRWCESYRTRDGVGTLVWDCTHPDRVEMRFNHADGTMYAVADRCVNERAYGGRYRNNCGPQGRYFEAKP